MLQRIVVIFAPVFAAGQLSYSPGLHDDAITAAFDQVASDKSGDLAKLFETSVARKKITDGSCRVFGCSASRGPTQCFFAYCLCREGYETLDGSTCTKASSFAMLNASRIDVEYSVMETMRLMMRAGAVEPDKDPCPGSDVEMAKQAAEDATGTRVYNMSLCRISSQVYHASPFPVVPRSQLQSEPEDNGYDQDDNLRDDLYAVGTLRQWRTALIKVMSKEFLYAIALPDISEGSRRLGNLFHTLSDSFSQSHVNRKPSGSDVPSKSVCDALTVTQPISMNVVNWMHHVAADAAKDIYWLCAIHYGTSTVELWAAARKTIVTSADVANGFINRLTKEVLCPALPIDKSALDKPAGGANGYYGSDSFYPFIGQHPIMPRGVVAPADATRLVQGWSEALAAYRQTLPADGDRWLVPTQIILPPRNADPCMDADSDHVTDVDIQRITAGEIPPQYIVPVSEPSLIVV